MALTDDQKKGLEAIFPDEAQGVIDEAEAETKKLEEEGVEHKAADEDEAEEPKEAPPAQTIDLPELARELAKQFDVQLQPVAEMKQAIERQQERIEELEAQLLKEQRAEKRRQEEELPRMILSWESKASEAEETVLEDDDPLLKMKPAEVKPTSGSGADHFFGSKK